MGTQAKKSAFVSHYYTTLPSLFLFATLCSCASQRRASIGSPLKPCPRYRVSIAHSSFSDASEANDKEISIYLSFILPCGYYVSCCVGLFQRRASIGSPLEPCPRYRVSIAHSSFSDASEANDKEISIYLSFILPCGYYVSCCVGLFQRRASIGSPLERSLRCRFLIAQCVFQSAEVRGL